MTTPELDFRIDWLGDASSTDPEVPTFGALELRAGDVILTEVEDLLARTTRPSIRVSLNRLARWLTDNWWRLRWEPPADVRTPSFRMAHEVAAAGGGFVWPSMTVASDGVTITLRTEPTTTKHTVRYLIRHEAQCSASTFERVVDRLVSEVLAREQALGSVDTHLHRAWRGLLEERSNPEWSAFRKREALMGFDPDEVDPELLEDLFQRGAWLGSDALDEALAGVPFAAAGPLLDQLDHMKRQGLETLSIGSVLDAAKGWPAPPAGAEAWQRGASLARHLRRRWQLGAADSLSDELLGQLLGGVDIHAAELGRSPGRLSLAFREDGALRPALKTTPYRTNRRFEVSRLLADAVLAPPSDTMLALTHAKTVRQRTQRAFAQELLCPVEGLGQRLSLPYPDEAELAGAAEHYGVSELLVRSTLVNEDLVPRHFLLGPSS
jgi:hypothetical protein